MQERRKLARTRVLKRAKFYLGKSTVIDCVVRDLTNVGAGVEVPNTIDLPETVDLTFDGGRSIRRGRSVWRKLNKTGVEFIESDRNRQR
jgi:two-component system cell cycle response regulator